MSGAALGAARAVAVGVAVAPVARGTSQRGRIRWGARSPTIAVRGMKARVLEAPS